MKPTGHESGDNTTGETPGTSKRINAGLGGQNGRSARVKSGGNKGTGKAKGVKQPHPYPNGMA